MLPIHFSATQLHDEWNCLILKNFKYDLTERIDIFWSDVFRAQNNLNEYKYPTIKKILRAALSISHRAADIERGFSESNRIMPDEKACMSLRMFNPRKYIKDGLRLFRNKPQLVPINNNLLFAAENSKKNYKAYLENERQKKENHKNNIAVENEQKRKRKVEENDARKKITLLEDDYKKVEFKEESKRSMLMIYLKKLILDKKCHS